MKGNVPNSLIADNRKARYNYNIEQPLEAGIVLEGWEVKSLRAGRAQISESYVVIKNGEAYLINANISPLPTVSTHIKPIADRSRKLLLNKRELDKLIGSVQRLGFTIIPLNLHWRRGKAKIEIALAKGKKLHDKRATEKNREWQREKKTITNYK
jgi:SsrA-binding protein